MERKGARLASFGVFVALALIFSYIETLIPFQIGIPGVKLGLANLVIVIALYRMPVGEVYLLSGVRVVLTGFLFGNLMSILYSLAGGILSLTVMWGMKRIRSVSILGVSIAGGVFHNIGQLLAAALMVETYGVFSYLPVLLISGLLTGFVIGLAAGEMLKRIRSLQFLQDGGYDMISYIRGELADVREDQVVIDVGGVGYGIFMSGSDIARLPSTGQEVKINTYLHVKEDVMQLFGFLTRDGLEVFRLIIGVSGIGPKGGLNILNQMTPNDLRFAVLAGDVKAISKAQGIGKKTAEKLILELKDKLERTEAGGNEPEGKTLLQKSAGTGEIQGEAVEALVALGYGSTEAFQAVRSVEIDGDSTVEEVLKKALRQMSLF